MASTSTKNYHQYKGIRCRGGKWVSEIREPRKTTRIWLGTYPTAEMAAAAHDVASLALKGKSAFLNFPAYTELYPIPTSASPTDIQNAAAAAAMLMQVADDQAIGMSQCYQETMSTSSPSLNNEFVDEDALFGMPNLLVDMAEGMLLSPPRINSLSSYDSLEYSNDGESLWSYV